MPRIGNPLPEIDDHDAAILVVLFLGGALFVRPLLARAILLGLLLVRTPSWVLAPAVLSWIEGQLESRLLFMARALLLFTLSDLLDDERG